MTLIISRSAKFLVNAIHSTIFYVSLKNVYHISISPLAQTNSTMGTHRAKNESRWPKWWNVGNCFLMCVIFEKQCHADSYTMTIKQNVWFQEGICLENCQLDQIQNGRLSAIIDYNMHNIWKTVPDSWTITVKQNVLLHGRMHTEKFNSIQFKIANFRPFFFWHLSRNVNSVRKCKLFSNAIRY